MGAFGKHLAESATAFRSVFTNPNLRRLQLAAVGQTIGAWAYSVAVSVYAYEHGGAKTVALVWLIRMVPAAVCAPLGGIVADRFRRERVMLTSDLARAAAIAAAGAAVWAHASPSVVYVLSGVISLAKLPFGPAESAITPSLATTPTELTAANVVGSTIDSVGFFVGPAIAGIFLGFTSVQVIFMVTAGAMVWSASFVSRIRPPQAAGQPEAVTEIGSGLLKQALVGFKTLGTDPRLRLLVGLLAATTLVVGALEVLTVSIAFQLLHIGKSGVGYLNAAFGVGALVGAIGAAGMVGLQRLSIPFLAGALLWGPPIVIIGAWPREWVTIVCLGLLGVGNTLIDVAGFTLVQRVVPDAILARVFGVLQMLWLGTIGIGAIIAPGLISGLGGIRAALIATGCFVPALLVVFGPRLIRIDAAATAPDRGRLTLLRRSLIFASLPGASIEALAGRLIPLHLAAGTQLMSEGDPGDRFYLIASGQVEVSAKGVPVATLGPGDHVGEIALLRDVPRTATVRASTEVDVFALERDDFLSSVTAHAQSREALEAGVTARLSGLQAAKGRVPVPSF